VNAQCKKTKLAAAQATNERSTASPYLWQISVHPAFLHQAKKMISLGAKSGLHVGCGNTSNPRLSTVSTTARWSVREDLSGNAAILIAC